MEPEQITSLGDALAIAAVRAIRNGDRAGFDQNRGQFVNMVKESLATIPDELRGEWTKDFLNTYATSAHTQ